MCVLGKYRVVLKTVGIWRWERGEKGKRYKRYGEIHGYKTTQRGIVTVRLALRGDKEGESEETRETERATHSAGQGHRLAGPWAGLLRNEPRACNGHRLLVVLIVESKMAMGNEQWAKGYVKGKYKQQEQPAIHVAPDQHLVASARRASLRCVIYKEGATHVDGRHAVCGSRAFHLRCTRGRSTSVCQPYLRTLRDRPERTHKTSLSLPLSTFMFTKRTK